MFRKHAAVVALLCLSTFAAAKAQETSGHDHSKMTEMDEAGQGPASKAYADANARMHRDMALALTGDADIDFVRSMIPHHQGAIDMAKIELQYGKDPEIRKLAEAVVKAQEAEIAEMQDWLKKRGQ